MKDQGQPAADEQPLADVSVNEVTVEAVYMTSVGGVARVRAGGRDVLVRTGDQLADGEVDGIDFHLPTVAWVRFKRQGDPLPGVPYNLIIWVLVARRGPAPPGSGLAIEKPAEVHVRVEDFRSVWEIPLERAPRLVAEMLQTPEVLAQVQAPGDGAPADGTPGSMIHIRMGFGTTDGRVDVLFTSRESLVRAMAAEGIPASVLRPRPRAPRPPRPAAPFWLGPFEEFAYDPGPRRDPFIDLSAWPVPGSDRGVRPEGIADLLIDEVEVEGLFVAPNITFVEIRSDRGRYLIREGEQLYDGDVVAIDPQEGVIFKQIIQDPTAPRPFRRVVKRVNPRWNGAAAASREAAGEAPSRPPAATYGWRPPKRDWPGRSWIDEAIERDEEILYPDLPSRSAEPAGRRDPFRSLVPGGTPAESPPSALAKLTCDDLTQAEADILAGVLERANRRLDRYLWERRLVAEAPQGRGSWARRFLDDVAQVASADLARVLGELHSLKPLRSGSAPPPAEMFALVGDLNLISGRLAAAAESYGFAERISPGQETLCGHVYDGRLYGAESYLAPAIRDGRRWHWLTGYLLAWDLASGRVEERHLLPAMPEAFAVRRGKLQIALQGAAQGTGLRGAGVVELAGRRLAEPVWVSTDLSLRLSAIQNGRALAQNFIGPNASSPSFEVHRYFDPRLPLGLPEVEKALRAAAARDPTQPWHPFLLGQALWAQGRRQEAETLWRDLWTKDGARATPYYELLWMAMLYEGFGHRGWADRVFARALEQRRHLSRPVDFTEELERRRNTGSFWLEDGVPDFERRYLWWRRLREISGVAPGDGFRAALWAAALESRGEERSACDELAYLERARRHPFDMTARSAWLDYSLYLVLALAAMLFAQLAVFIGRTLQRLEQGRLVWPGWRKAARTPLQGLPLLLTTALLCAALSVAVLAASYLGYLMARPSELGDVAATKEGPDRPDLLHAWLTTGIVKPEEGTPARLARTAQELRSRSAGVQALPVLAGFVAMFMIALPAGLFLTWGRTRALLTRWIPGAAQVRTGARLRGYAVFGLFVFAVSPLLWLAIARTNGAVPAPGLVSANFFLGAGLERPLLPLSTPDALSPGASEDERESRRQSNFERLRAGSFFRLLLVYPGAAPFWLLVACALAVSLSVHTRTKR